MMLRSYMLIAFRRLARERIYVVINVLSLALGLASFLILALYLRSELTYDRHNANYAQIYRVIARFQRAGNDVTNFATSQVGIGQLLTRDYPQLGKYARFRPWTENVLRYEDNQRQWERVYLADPTAFDIFTHHVLYGSSATALQDPTSIAISETVAKHYFGDENPIGKSLSSGGRSHKVTLVFADLPENTHLRYDVLLPMSLMDALSPGYATDPTATLWAVHVFTYLLVEPDFKRDDFAEISQTLFRKYMAERSEQLKMTFQADIQPLADVHFGEKLTGDLLTGNIFYVYGFAAVALFILSVACINYINLATARSGKRAKEVGMRKVLGAHRPQIALQFFGESLTFTAIALVLAWVLIELAIALTPLGTLMGKEHLLDVRADPLLLVGVIVLGFTVALAAGLYPALYLSSISPLAALTHAKRSWKTGVSMRQMLVLSQLTISIGVIACASIMLSQMRYLERKPLGFEKENRLLVTLRGFDVVRQLKTIKNELRRQRNVVDVTVVGSIPGTGHATNMIPTENNEGIFEPVDLHRIMIGTNFVESMKLKVVEGRGLSDDVASDARASALVNEFFVRKMGWQRPLGKRFRLGPNEVRVVGVVKDFHYTSLHNEIGPLLMLPVNEDAEAIPENQRALATSSLVVIMTGDDIRETMNRIKATIGRFDPSFYFEPIFLEDRLQELYQSESRLMKLTGIFAGVCIFISLMGLYGLTLFSTEQRTREIGIRKVLGASDARIVGLFSRYLIVLVLVAAVPASVVSYYAMSVWLKRFAYHADVDIAAFAMSTFVVAVVALITTAWQAARAARSNPADSLRYE